MKNIINKKRIIVIALLLIGIVSGGGYYYWKKQQQPEVTFKEVKPNRGDLVVSILSTGVVQPENRLEIKPPIAGRVETVLVDEGKRVKKGQVLAWMSSTERAALLDAARAKGPDELKHWEELYRATPILAPINGMIISRNTEAGQTFTGQDPIFVMSDRLTIKAQVDETDIAQIKLHQKADVILDAYPGQTFDANVDQIAYDAKTVNNVTTYIVDVLPEETPAFLRSGMTANVTFYVAEKTNVMVLPNDAIKAEDGDFYVMLKPAKPGESPKKQEIETGITDGKRTEIISGLNESDIVLVTQYKGRAKNSGQSSPFSPMGSRRRN